jgi:ABC-type branched-subunit amino acid transport system substrate-binding protein
MTRYATDMQAVKQRVIIRQVKLVNNDNAKEFIQAVTEKFKYVSQHAGIAPIIDSFYEQEYCYFVQPAPTGELLATLMQRRGGSLPEHLVIEYGKQLCWIAVLLEEGPQSIVHGAISPQTVMIDQEKHLASLLHLPLLPPSLLPEDNPAGYIPPEQVHRQITPSSDLYAIAATMHHAVTGYSPYERLVHFYPPARRLNPKVTPELEAILAHQLRLSTRQRYPNAQSMVDDLDKLSYAPEVVEESSPPLNQFKPQQVSTWSLLKQRPIFASSLIILCLIVIFSLVTLGNLIQTNQNNAHKLHAQQAAYAQQLKTELDTFNKQGIGISDGRMVFDTYKGRLDTTLKTKAASAIQAGDISTATNLLNQAISADPIDGEAQIYNENLRILIAKEPYVTIVIGLPIDGSDEYLNSARGELQSAYLAQHKANTQHRLPNGLKLRLLIANSGGNNDHVATVARYIATRVSQGGNPDNIVATIGWPYSSQTVNALNILASVHIPLISQTASSIKLSGSSPYLFRVCPADDSQGQALGTLLTHKMNVKKLLILHDPADTYSTSLANAVASSTQSSGTVIRTGTFTETKTTVDQYQQFANQATAEQYDAIFIAGYTVDGIRLAHAIGEASRANPNNKTLNSLKIVGGDALTYAALLGIGNNDDALIARTNPQDMRRISATEFADASEWNFLRIAQNKQPQFFTDWATTYQSSTIGPKAAAPIQEGILIYDAVSLVVYAASLHSNTPTGDTIRNTLPTLGNGNVAAYQGVSGRIAFTSQGNPADKAIVIVTVQDRGDNHNELRIQDIIGKFQ